MLYSGVAELQAFEGVDKETLIKELELENEGGNNTAEGNTPGISDNKNPNEMKVNGQTTTVTSGKKGGCKC